MLASTSQSLAHLEVRECARPAARGCEGTNEWALSPRRRGIGRSAPASWPSSGRGAPRRNWDRRARCASVPGARARSRGGRGGRSRAVSRWSELLAAAAAATAATGGGAEAGSKDCEVGNREFLDSLSGILSAAGELSFVRCLGVAGAGGFAAAVAQR